MSYKKKNAPENFKNTELAKEKAKEVVANTKTRACDYFTEEQNFDIKENMMFGILYGMKRSDIITNSKQLAENMEVFDVTEKRLISIYNTARDELFTYRLGTIEQEKQKFLERMYRLGAKAETQGDFSNAFKAYEKIAQVAGVYAESDESKVILNFVPVKSSRPKADDVLEINAEFSKKE